MSGLKTFILAAAATATCHDQRERAPVLRSLRERGEALVECVSPQMVLRVAEGSLGGVPGQAPKLHLGSLAPPLPGRGVGPARSAD